MYISTKSEYDWETREDAQSLLRSNAVKKDPQRLARAKACLKEVSDTLHGACKDCKTASANKSRTNNPATLGKLNINK